MRIDPDLIRKVQEECSTLKKRVSELETENKLLRMGCTADNADVVNVVNSLQLQVQELLVLNNKHISQVNALVKINDTYVQKLSQQDDEITRLKKDVCCVSNEIAELKVEQTTQNQLLVYTCSKIQLDTMIGFVDKHFSTKIDVHHFYERYMMYVCESQHVRNPNMRKVQLGDSYLQNIYQLLSTIIGKQSEFDVIHKSCITKSSVDLYDRRDRWVIPNVHLLKELLDDINHKINNHFQFHFIKFLQHNLNIIDDEVSNQLMSNIYCKPTS